MGYDISNYEEVYPPYGTVADMESLIQACHERYGDIPPSSPGPTARGLSV